MNLEDLPRDPTFSYALYLNPIDLMNTCLSSKEFNRKICDNQSFWLEKLKIDFGSEGIEDNEIEDYKKLYYQLAYDRYVLYHNDKKIAKRVKKVVNEYSFIYYLTFFGDLYRYEKSNSSKHRLIASNIFDISYKYALKNDGKLYNLGRFTNTYAENVDELISDEFYKKTDGNVYHFKDLIGKDIISAYIYSIEDRKAIIYVNSSGQLIFLYKNASVTSLENPIKKDEMIVCIKEKVKDFIIYGKKYNLLLGVIDENDYIYAVKIEYNHEMEISKVLNDKVIRLVNGGYINILGSLFNYIDDEIIDKNVLYASINGNDKLIIKTD